MLEISGNVLGLLLTLYYENTFIFSAGDQIRDPKHGRQALYH
jgi:hypothetical protein